MDEINKSIEVLQESGFYADNLWHIDSVEGLIPNRLAWMYSRSELMDMLAEAVNDPEVERLIIHKIRLALNKTIK